MLLCPIPLFYFVYFVAFRFAPSIFWLSQSLEDAWTGKGLDAEAEVNRREVWECYLMLKVQPRGALPLKLAAITGNG